MPPKQKAYKSAKAYKWQQKAYKSQKAWSKPSSFPTGTHNRSTTAYNYFNKVGKRLQGPHTISHVFTTVGLEKIFQNEDIKDLRVLLDTRLIPSPGKANAILKEGLGEKGRLEQTALQRNKFLGNYSSLYNRLAESEDREVQARLVSKLVELSPQQTYGWAKGSYTPAEIAGKGERKPQAKKDYLTLEDFSKATRSSGLTAADALDVLDIWTKGGFKSFDKGSLSDNDVRRMLSRARQYPKAANFDTLSQASNVSDLDFLTKTAGKYFPNESLNRAPGGSRSLGSPTGYGAATSRGVGGV